MVLESANIVKHPIVSVVVITYNQDQYISQCVDAVLAQETDFPFEIIISDDCSTDTTREICKGYQQKYPDKIKLLLQENNRGVARNFGDAISLARGKYVSSMGGDDFWITDQKLQIQKDYLDAHPRCGLCYTNINICDEYGNIIKHSALKDIELSKSLEEHLLSKGYIAPLTWMYRRELVEKYDMKGAYSDESFGFALDVFATSYVDYIDVVTANYRTVIGSLSRPRNNIKWYKQYLGVFRAQQYYCEKYHLSEDFHARVDVNGYLELLPYAIYSGDYSFKNEAVQRLNGLGFDITQYITTCEENEKLNDTLKNIRNSYAYRLGKFLLRPYSWIRRKI